MAREELVIKLVKAVEFGEKFLDLLRLHNRYVYKLVLV